MYEETSNFELEPRDDGRTGLRWLRCCAALVLLTATSAAFAAFHLFRIDQLYSNADGTVQFIVMHESSGTNFENVWAGNMITNTATGGNHAFQFQTNLPNSSTAGRRVLIATQGFAALGLVTPDYVIPNGFLSTGGGTFNYAGVDQVTYPALPTDGVHAIDRNGTVIQNLATNFAGQTGSVSAAPAQFTPAIGLWWNPNESGSGYNFDFKHGVLVVTVFTYEAVTGHSEWYLASGPLTDNVFTGTLDKYRNGQCVTCPYTNPGPPAGNDGVITIRFTSATSAVMTLPGRVTNVVPQAF